MILDYLSEPQMQSQWEGEAEEVTDSHREEGKVTKGMELG